MKLEFSGQIFEKYSNIKFHENPFRGRLVSSGWTDMMKLIDVFRNFANAPDCEGECMWDMYYS
jgi:hypothetical protein